MLGASNWLVWVCGGFSSILTHGNIDYVGQIEVKNHIDPKRLENCYFERIFTAFVGLFSVKYRIDPKEPAIA